MLDLFMIVLSVTGPSQFSQEQKDEIVREMNARGYDIVWNGLRYFFSPALFCASVLSLCVLVALDCFPGVYRFII